MRLYQLFIVLAFAFISCDSSNFKMERPRSWSMQDSAQEKAMEEICPSVKVRKANEVAIRALIVNGLVHVSHNLLDNKKLVTYLKQYSLWEYTSPNEQKFLSKSKPDDEEINDLSWRIECLNVLLWSLNKLDTISDPSTGCGYKIFEAIPSFEVDPTNWINEATIRSTNEISCLTEKTYNIHWSVRDAQLNDSPIPNEYDPLIVEQRHYALNWLTLYAQEWDDITTDT